MADFKFADENDLAALLEEIRKRVPFSASCSTAAATAAKVITGLTGFELRKWATINVYFTYSNSVANPTLSVNGSDPIAIKRYGTTAPSTSATTSWNAGSIVTLTYTGTYWIIHDWLNNDTKNTAGTTNKVGTKLFLVGATGQSANPTTYSNVGAYVGEDNELYSNGQRVLTAALGLYIDDDGYVCQSVAAS